MPVDTVTETVTVEREALYQLLVEVHGVHVAADRLAGPDLTDAIFAPLMLKADVVERTSSLEMWPEDDDESGVIWDDGYRRSKELLTLVGPAVARMLARKGDDAR